MFIEVPNIEGEVEIQQGEFALQHQRTKRLLYFDVDLRLLVLGNGQEELAPIIANEVVHEVGQGLAYREQTNLLRRVHLLLVEL